MADPTNAVRKVRLRKARRDSGKVELRLWVSPRTKADLGAIAAANGGLDLASALSLMVFAHSQVEKVSECA